MYTHTCSGLPAEVARPGRMAGCDDVRNNSQCTHIHILSRTHNNDSNRTNNYNNTHNSNNNNHDDDNDNDKAATTCSVCRTAYRGICYYVMYSLVYVIMLWYVIV